MQVIGKNFIYVKKEWKNDGQKWSIWSKLHCNFSQWYSILCMGLTCVFACMTVSVACSQWEDRWCPGGSPACGLRHYWAPGESEVHPGGIGWTETQERCSGPRDVLFNLGQESVGATQWYQFLYPTGPGPDQSQGNLLPPGVDLPILEFYGKWQLCSTVPASEHRAH